MSDQIVFSACSAACGQGKTYNFIKLAQSGRHPALVYAAPTEDLIHQTRTELEQAGVHVVVRTTSFRPDYRESVQDGIIKALKANYTQPTVLLVTHPGLIAVLASKRVDRQFLKSWECFIDETCTTVEGLTVSTKDEKYMEPIAELLDFTAEELAVKSKHRDTADLVIDGKSGQHNLENDYFKDLLRACDSPAYMVIGHLQPTKIKATKILVPSIFADFGTVVILSALFEQTLMQLIWTKYFNVKFKPYAEIYRGLKKKFSHTEGHRVSIRYLLDDNDSASMSCLESEQEGQSIIARAQRIIANHWNDGSFCYVINHRFSNEGQSAIFDALEDTEKLPGVSHGSNKWIRFNRVATIQVTQPDNTTVQDICKLTGISNEECRSTYRLHSQYQAACRSSIRDGNSSAPVEMIVLDLTIAKQFQEIFEGSTIVGKLGDIQRYSSDRGRVRPDSVSKADWKSYKNYRNRIDARIASGKSLTTSQMMNAEKYEALGLDCSFAARPAIKQVPGKGFDFTDIDESEVQTAAK